jgi:hypothetical protein
MKLEVKSKAFKLCEGVGGNSNNLSPLYQKTLINTRKFELNRRNIQSENR